jgi:hypothetical protein
VVCNLRPQQRPAHRQGSLQDFTYQGIWETCRAIPQIKNKQFVIHFQQYNGPALSTTVVDVWHCTLDGGARQCYRLDFDWPSGMSSIYDRIYYSSTGCSRPFLSPFILALAQMPPETPIGCWEDPDASHFQRIIETYRFSK